MCGGMPYGHAPRRARRLDRRRLAVSGGRSGRSGPRGRPRPVRRRRRPRSATLCPDGPRPALRLAVAVAGRPRLRRPSPLPAPASRRRARRRPRGASSTRRPRGSQAPDVARMPPGHAALARHARPDASRGRRTSSLVAPASRAGRVRASGPAASVADLRFAMRAGAPPPGFGARSTIAQALAAGCGRPGRAAVPRGHRAAGRASWPPPSRSRGRRALGPPAQPAGGDRLPEPVAATGALPASERD